MSQLLNLNTYRDERGALTVLEKVLSFEIKRVYYIYAVNPEKVRGGHRHKTTYQALICLNGACTILCNDGIERKTFQLTDPNQCLIVDPKDYHSMKFHTTDSILLVLASEYFNDEDYIDEDYNNL